MIERYSVLGTECDGVFFTEADLLTGTPKGRVHVEISRQNSNLAEVKRRLAREAKARGANVVAGWTYGQKGHSWLGLLAFKWDTESWHGEGRALFIERTNRAPSEA